MAILGMDGFDHYITDTGGGTIDDVLANVEGYSTISGQTNQRLMDTDTRFGSGKYLRHIYTNAELRVSTAGQITDTLFISAAIRFTNGSGTADIIHIYDDDSSHVQLSLECNASGQMGFYRAGSTLLGSLSTETFSLDVWYWMEVKVKISNTVGTVQLQMNGIDWVNETAQDTLNSGGVDIGSFKILGDSTPYLEWDDLVWQDDAGDFLGDSRIETFMPNGESSIQWTPSTGTDNSALVDEIPTNDDTDYVSSSTLNHLDLYDVDALTDDDTIHGVSVHFRARKTDTGARSIESRTKSSSNEQGGADKALTTSYVNYRDMYETTDDGTTAWTKTLFDAAQFGVKVTV